MSELEHRYLTVAYKLFVTNSAGVQEIMEEATPEHPFQFITHLGACLESFEEKVGHLAAGEAFDFTLSMEEAYGPYEEERLVEVPKEAFMVDGRFDDKVIFAGNYIPLVNAEGQRFEGLVVDVKEESVRIDLNSPLAGKELHYVGQVVTARPASVEEVSGFLNMLTGGCGCGGHGHEDGGCGCGGHGHGHHHHEDGGCGCGGHGHGHHHHEDGGCGCGGHGHGHHHHEDSGCGCGGHGHGHHHHEDGGCGCGGHGHGHHHHEGGGCACGEPGQEDCGCGGQGHESSSCTCGSHATAEGLDKWAADDEAEEATQSCACGGHH